MILGDGVVDFCFNIDYAITRLPRKLRISENNLPRSDFPPNRGVDMLIEPGKENAFRASRLSTKPTKQPNWHPFFRMEIIG